MGERGHPGIIIPGAQRKMKGKPAHKLQVSPGERGMPAILFVGQSGAEALPGGAPEPYSLALTLQTLWPVNAY